MTRPPSAEFGVAVPAAGPTNQGVTKRKGTRSVSTLTPSQLARKRASDREAQRAIRARTKEHIDRLEREIAELKSKISHDWTVQELLQKNRALEEEMFRLEETMRQSFGHSYSSLGDDASAAPPTILSDADIIFPVYDNNNNNNNSSVSGAAPSHRSTPFPRGEGGTAPWAELDPSYVPSPTTQRPVPLLCRFLSTTAQTSTAHRPTSLPRNHDGGKERPR
ncbi:hypothetical protein EDB81DRAFT_247748 [Dactylonectria macrodidyma]|uniref:BZIP transcription factor n=1 Tax=Dactylonectria macrodidyma TaxID=307937 RepID=A0A9P9DCE7_9HYPO|nr:hypothetical protein EDB81DRAFT_247748 [Dactylonectria macrodidyma]